jgi:hypothetical protein
MVVPQTIGLSAGQHIILHEAACGNGINTQQSNKVDKAPQIWYSELRPNGENYIRPLSLVTGGGSWHL